MATLQHIQQLMTELGPLVDDIGLIEQSEEDTWLVAFDDETAVQIECDEAANKLIFLMAVAEAPEPDQSTLYAAMLNWNFLYEDTGGMRLSLAGDREVVLLVDLCHLNLEAHTLAAFLESFTAAGLGWRQILLAESHGVGTPDDEGDRPADAIQV